VLHRDGGIIAVVAIPVARTTVRRLAAGVGRHLRISLLRLGKVVNRGRLRGMTLGSVEGSEAPGAGPHIRVLTDDSSKRNLRRNNREMIVGMHLVNSPSSQTMTPEGLRVRARQVRALARSVAHHEAAPTIRAFADELEAKADALEIYSVSRNDGTPRAGVAGPLPNA
jgi:hypothetical protein